MAFVGCPAWIWGFPEGVLVVHDCPCARPRRVGRGAGCVAVAQLANAICRVSAAEGRWCLLVVPGGEGIPDARDREGKDE